MLLKDASYNFKSASDTAPREALVTVRAYLASIGKSGAGLFPGADAGGDGRDRFFVQMFAAFAGVIAVALLKLQKKARHAQWPKRGSERLVTGGS